MIWQRVYHRLMKSDMDRDRLTAEFLGLAGHDGADLKPNDVWAAWIGTEVSEPTRYNMVFACCSIIAYLSQLKHSPRPKEAAIWCFCVNYVNNADKSTFPSSAFGITIKSILIGANRAIKILDADELVEVLYK